MRVIVEVRGAEVVARDLDRIGAGLADPAPALIEAGARLALSIWERVLGQSPDLYSAKYVGWLMRTGDWAGKKVGLLSGRMLGATAPGPGAAGTALGSEIEAGGEAVLVGLLDPTQEAKSRGFAKWYAEKYGEDAVRVTEADERDIEEIFDRWAEGVIDG